MKKSGGSGSSIKEEILTAATKTRELWTEEIKVMNPDIVICGGTFSIIKQILEFDTYTVGSGAKAANVLGTTFIDFYHPAYRVSPKLLYAYFKETIFSL